MNLQDQLDYYGYAVLASKEELFWTETGMATKITGDPSGYSFRVIGMTDKREFLSMGRGHPTREYKYFYKVVPA